MSDLPYPRNAWEIVKARANGMRPEGPVLVVLHGQHDIDNAMVYAEPNVRYRWDWVRGLPNVVVLIGSGTRMGTILADIMDAGPLQLDVIDHERELGWLVNLVRPKLRTVRWPQSWVRDWLGSCEWHRALQAAKLSVLEVPCI
jgi:hypothetical protein